MTTCQNPSTFNDFENLSQFFRGRHKDLLYVRGLDGKHPRPPLKFSLHIQLDEIALSDLRINALTLFRITYIGLPKTIALFSRGPKGEPDRQSETHEVALQTMRRSGFVLLSSILLQAPNLATQLAPEIWFDGSGAAVEATYGSGPTTKGIPNPSYGRSEEDTWIMGRDYMTELGPPQRLDQKAVGAYFRGRSWDLSYGNSNSLQALWKAWRGTDMYEADDVRKYRYQDAYGPSYNWGRRSYSTGKIYLWLQVPPPKDEEEHDSV